MEPKNLPNLRGQVGVLGQFFVKKVCGSPGYGGPGTFYGIEKYCPYVEKQSFKVGHFLSFRPEMARKGPQNG